MKKTVQDESRIESLERLCRDITMERCELSIIRDKLKTGSDLVATFRPYNSKAAKIEVEMDIDFGINLLLGEASPFEIPFAGGYYTSQPWLEEVRAFCLAIMAGHFQERLIEVRGKIKGSDHCILLPTGKEVREHWRKGILLPFAKKQERLMRYEPY